MCVCVCVCVCEILIRCAVGALIVYYVMLFVNYLRVNLVNSLLRGLWDDIKINRDKAGRNI